jgi:hypothetical protein
MKFSELRRQAVVEFIDIKKLNDKLVDDLGKGIYLSYPDFFYTLIFGEKVNFKNQKHTQFCVASYLMYRFLIEIDDVFDEKIYLIDSLSISKLLEKQNLSQRLLSDLFEFDSEFWNLYQSRQTTFIECLTFELTKIDVLFKQQHYSNPLNITFYRSYYAQKCIFSSLAIDGLYIMNGGFN